MKIIWSSHALDDYRHFQAVEPKIAYRIDEIVRDIERTPFLGIGKPEPLRGELSGFWSRRITKKHRFVYRVTGKRGAAQHLEIAQCRFHY